MDAMPISIMIAATTATAAGLSKLCFVNRTVGFPSYTVVGCRGILFNYLVE